MATFKHELPEPDDYRTRTRVFVAPDRHYYEVYRDSRLAGTCERVAVKRVATGGEGFVAHWFSVLPWER